MVCTKWITLLLQSYFTARVLLVCFIAVSDFSNNEATVSYRLNDLCFTNRELIIYVCVHFQKPYKVKKEPHVDDDSKSPEDNLYQAEKELLDLLRRKFADDQLPSPQQLGMTILISSQIVPPRMMVTRVLHFADIVRPIIGGGDIKQCCDFSVCLPVCPVLQVKTLHLLRYTSTPMELLVQWCAT